MRPHIPALTGIRFFAAFTVAVAHGLLAIATFRDDPWFIYQLKNVAAMGMSIFFVLSGFVIHYTYSQSLGRPNGLHNFFVARVARLYPLFIVVFIAEYAYMHLVVPGTIAPFGQDPRALRYYVTLTQTWWYAVFNDASIVYQFGPVAQISWSISTEIAFYLAYPLLLPLLSRLTRPRTIIVTWIAHCVLSIALICAATYYFDAISEVGLRAFGEIADARVSKGQDSLFRWLVYFSPYSRILEFIAGGLAAQLFITASAREAAPPPRRGMLLSGLAILALLATHLYFFAPDLLPFVRPKIAFYLYMSFGFAPACGFLIYCCARYRNLFTAPFTARPALVLGEASYSIYLLHMAFFSQFRLQPVEATAANIALRLGLFCAITAALFAASLVTHRLIEMPARRWIRAAFSLRADQSTAAWWRRRVTAIGIAALALALSAGTYFRDARLGFQRWQLASSAIAGEIAEGRINVVDGIYGASCVRVESNALESLRRNCNGRMTCDYVVNVAILGDPAPGCSKDFRAQWRCSSGGALRSVTVPPEAGLRNVARLSCAP